MSWRRFNKRQALLVRWGTASLIGAVLVVVAVAASSRQDRQAVPSVGVGVEGVTAVLTRDGSRETVTIRFEDVTARMGVSFRHFPAERASLLSEDMGSGVAWGDYDGDGFVDLFFVNLAGSALPGAAKDAEAGRCRLYRNVGGERFEDVTLRAGVGFVGQGMGAAWGDYDSDGDLDLYVTAVGDNALYQNLGQGAFREVTRASGTNDSRFSAGCSWADYDRDADLDLYVCNYVDFIFRQQDRGVIDRQYATEQPYTLNPSSYAPLPNSLFRNRGDGTFEEVAAQVGVANPTGRSLSASWVDLDNDGWQDLYVANDVSENGVFRNRGDGTFEDIGASSMAADYRGAMGLAVADFDNDLDQDILITHWIAQENALYRNMLLDPMLKTPSQQGLWFIDDADEVGLGQISLDMVGWAAGFCDFDNDGRRDLWVVNGSTIEHPDNHALLNAQRPFVFWNRGEQGFVEVGARVGARLGEPFVGRGGAAADFDNDGRIDVVLTVHGGEARIVKNVSEVQGHWLGLVLRQSGGNTFALGARAYITAGGRTWMAEVGSSSSYLSQDQSTLHFGLGERTSVDELRIVWPDGAQETHRDVAADQTVSLEHDAAYPVARELLDLKGPGAKASREAR